MKTALLFYIGFIFLSGCSYNHKIEIVDVSYKQTEGKMIHVIKNNSTENLSWQDTFSLEYLSNDYWELINRKQIFRKPIFISEPNNTVTITSYLNYSTGVRPEGQYRYKKNIKLGDETYVIQTNFIYTSSTGIVISESSIVEK